MSSKEKPILSFKNIYYAIHDTQILKNISGSFFEKKITTLVGPSGSGKTTLLKLCNGLISPTSGEIVYKDHPIHSYEPTQLRREIGMALQSAPMISGKVYDNLSLPRDLKGEPLSKEEAIHFLQDVGLDESFLTRKASDLSGGQKQRVSIARTLVNHSHILLLDEITSALDRTSRGDIEELVKKLNREYGVTIIWITHNIEQALSIGDHVWVLVNGELVEAGESTLLETSSNPLVRQFVEGDLK